MTKSALLLPALGFLLLHGIVRGAENVRRLETGWEFHQGGLGSTWEIWRGDKASDNVKWESITLPHCFNAKDAVDPDVPYYQGPGWYRNTVMISNPYPGGRTLLHFDGAGQKSQVFVGTEMAGGHTGGYDQWKVDITDLAAKAGKDGNVPLAVLCDNSRDAESIPSDLSDFCRYGGIYRHVNLVYVPPVSIERVRIEPVLSDDFGNARVTVRARFYNPTAAAEPLEISIEVRDPQGNVVHSATKTASPWAGDGELDVFAISSPQRWSPSSPALYKCSVTLKTPQGTLHLEESFGLRSFEWVEHGPFKLNGERLLLRGTHYHEDHARVGAAVPDEMVRRTLRAIKDMGANFVRLGHYQQSPLVLDLCDELGLLAWEEIPWCRGGLGGSRYRQQCRDMLYNMIDQHANHPSIILWGLGNENDWPGDFEEFDKNAIRSFMAELNEQAHRLDPSRRTAIRRCDFCKDIPDIYSPSIWAGWYAGRYTEYRPTVEKAIKDIPRFFHAEYGCDSHAGRHSEAPEEFLGRVATGGGTAEVGKAYKSGGGKARASSDGDWSESYAVNLFDWHLKEQEQIPDLTGAAMWIFKDFATPLRPENPVPRVNQKGVMERDGTLKESYYVFQSYWTEKPMIRIYGHTWPVRWGEAGETKQVKVFSNCGEVELFVNGMTAGVRKRNSADYPAAGLHWDIPFREGANTLRAVGRHGEVTVTDEIQTIYQTTRWSKPARITIQELSRENGVLTLGVQAADDKDVACLDASNAMRFGITGDGVLIDNLGTASGSRVVQLCNGRARISVRMTGQAAVASVSSSGLPTAFLKLENAQSGISSK